MIHCVFFNLISIFHSNLMNHKHFVVILFFINQSLKIFIFIFSSISSKQNRYILSYRFTFLAYLRMTLTKDYSNSFCNLIFFYISIILFRQLIQRILSQIFVIFFHRNFLNRSQRIKFLSLRSIYIYWAFFIGIE